MKITTFDYKYKSNKSNTMECFHLSLHLGHKKEHKMAAKNIKNTCKQSEDHRI